VIDLHLHTTASDGLLSPAQVVERLRSTPVHTFSVTDHDTVAGLEEAKHAAGAAGLRFVPGIEMTAVDADRDVHVLGYGIDSASQELHVFLRAQREARVRRARALIARLRELGLPLDAAEIIDRAGTRPSRAIGRPHIARAMIEAGYVASVDEAFEQWLARDRPAFVPRSGAPPEHVIEVIDQAGGVAVLAHPGLTRCDALIPSLAARGLGGLEVWHSEHDEHTSARYEALARELSLIPTGGSDFHGDTLDRPCRLGEVGMPAADFEVLMSRLSRQQVY
jgi:3',5'-nucleoside bisphosphate phosphatase